MTDNGPFFEQEYAYGPFGLERWTRNSPRDGVLRSRAFEYDARGALRTLTLQSPWYSAEISWTDGEGGRVASGTVNARAGTYGQGASLTIDGARATLTELRDWYPHSVTFDEKGRVRRELTSASFQHWDTTSEYDEEGHLVSYSGLGGDYSTWTVSRWDSGRETHSTRDWGSTSGVYGTAVTDWVYDAAGHLVGRRETIHSEDDGVVMRHGVTITVFSNSCSSGEPVRVTQYRSNGTISRGSVTYQRDEARRPVQAVYSGAAAEELGVVKREWSYGPTRP